MCMRVCIKFHLSEAMQGRIPKCENLWQRAVKAAGSSGPRWKAPFTTNYCTISGQMNLQISSSLSTSSLPSFSNDHEIIFTTGNFTHFSTLLKKCSTAKQKSLSDILSCAPFSPSFAFFDALKSDQLKGKGATPVCCLMVFPAISLFIGKLSALFPCQAHFFPSCVFFSASYCLKPSGRMY